MAQDINLLPEQTGEDKQQVKQKQLIAQVSVAVLAVTIVAVIGLFSAKLVLNAQTDAVNKKIAVQSGRIEAKKTVEGVYRSLDDKLTALSAFLAGQKHYTTFLVKFSQTVPNSMTLTDMNSTSANLVTISGKVNSYSDLAGFYQKLSTAGPTAANSNQASDSATPATSTTPYFVSPTLLTITRDDPSGPITFTMSFTLSPLVLAGETT